MNTLITPERLEYILTKFFEEFKQHEDPEYGGQIYLRVEGDDLMPTLTWDATDAKPITEEEARYIIFDAIVRCLAKWNFIVIYTCGDNALTSIETLDLEILTLWTEDGCPYEQDPNESSLWIAYD